MTNNIFIKEGEESVIPLDELTISIETLEKVISDKESSLNTLPTNFKILLTKTAYELGYYYMLLKNYTKSKDFFNYVIRNFNSTY